MSSISTRRRPALAAVAATTFAVAAAVLSPSLGSPLAGRAAAPITFETPSVVDPLQAGGEPDINVDSQGRVFASAPTGTGTQRSIWYASVDGGHSYRAVSPNKPANSITTFSAPPGGGDTDIQFDRSGKQYFSDLYALACFRTATTADAGMTVSSNPTGGCAKTNGSGGDRQWLLVYDPAPGTPKLGAYTGPTPLVYMEYNAYPTGGTEWEQSSAANDTSTGGPGLQFTHAIANCPESATCSPFGHDGYPSIDQATGDVFEANYNAGSAAGLSDIDLNIGVPDASGNLNFRDLNSGPGLITVAKDVVDDRGDVANFVVSSMDQGRNLWVAWVARANDATKSQTYVAVASAASGWTQWSKPVQVSSPAGGSYTSIFPWIKAGGPGRADVVWYGADRYTDPSVDNGQSWNTFMAQVVWPVAGNGGASVNATPSVQQVKVSPHPMKYGDVCLQGTGCITVQGNRNLADFFNVSIDRSGAAEVIYDDTSNGLFQNGLTPGGQNAVDHPGAPILTVARQASGPGLYGSDVSGVSNAATDSITGPSGDALFPVIGGTNVPGMDLLGTRLSLSGTTLKVVMTVADLSNPSGTAVAAQGALLQYVTRWQMGNVIYYAGFETDPSGQVQQFYAGPAQSVDLCSVSACDPHVVYYPESGTTAHSETGTVTCPSSPSAATPCTVEIDVNTADVGTPTAPSVAAHVAAATGSLLEEVGSYAFSSLTPQASLNNGQGQVDNLPVTVDGMCCFNFRQPTTTSQGNQNGQGQNNNGQGQNGNGNGNNAAAAPLPNTSSAPAAGAATAAALIGVVALVNRRRRGRASRS